MTNRFKRVLFIGSKEIGLRAFSRICSLTPDRIAGAMTFEDSTDSRSVFHRLQAVAEQNGVPFQVARNRLHSQSLIHEFKPDLCLVAGWYWLIPEELINVVPGGFLGIHHSLLPAYRGGSPVVWAIINGETHTGTSLFSFTAGMDDGPLWGQRRVTIRPDAYVQELLDQLSDAALDVLIDSWEDILDGRIEPTEQTGEATYCAQRQPSDGQIDFGWPAERVFDFIRAQSHPYPGAFTRHEGKQLTIWRATPLDRTYYGTAGQVTRVLSEDVIVACGNGTAIALEEVSFPPGEDRCPASEVLRSIKIRLPNFGEVP